jgi:hypothetical protein
MNLIEIRHELQKKHEKNKVILPCKTMMDVSNMWNMHMTVSKIAVAHLYIYLSCAQPMQIDTTICNHASIEP